MGLEARPGTYPYFVTEEEIRRHLAELQRKDGEFTRLVAQVEERQHSYAENVHRLNVVNDLIAKRRAREQEFEGEQDDYENDEDEDDSEKEAYEGEQSIRMKLGHLRIH